MRNTLLPKMVSVRLDYSYCGTPTFKLSDHPSYRETLTRARDLHALLLQGQSELLKDGAVVMTGWKTDSPFITKEKLDEIISTANSFRSQIDDFISIGIGGSYLGIRAVLEAVQGALEFRAESPRIFFLGHHMDPAYISRTIDAMRGRRVGINAISKSGGTVEPAIAFALALAQFSDAQVIATTDAQKGALREMANAAGWKTFNVPDNVGGRYSVTTPVGLFGLAVAGVDIHAFIAGARDAESTIRSVSPEENPAFIRAALRFLAHKREGKKIEVASTGTYDLHSLTAWYQQLAPESEGKNGEGLFVTPEFYTRDAHANGQLIQEGERNIMETFFMVEKPKTDITISAKGSPVAFLDGKSLHAVNTAFLEGIRDAHHRGGVPCMSWVFPEITPYTIGYYMQLEMNAVALSALLMGQNPFIQPGVQAYKEIATRRVLSMQ